MKIRTLLSVSAVAVLFAACTNKKVVPGTYVDLNTGRTINVIADPTTGYAYNADTKKPVYLYVSETDTIFTTGQKVNHMIIPTADGKYEVDGAKVKVDDDKVKIKYADYVKEYDNDSYTIKDGDYKKKVEADGDIKIKDGDYKKKVQADGDVKIKTEDTKTKIEDGKAVTKERKKIL
jgi:hypothetical protein